MNSKVNYLTNAREIAVTATKGKKPTFHSSHDPGIYKGPTSRRGRVHPTQKPLWLMKALIEKHSNIGDLVFDPFAGSGTSLVAAKQLGRRYLGCELSPEYAEHARRRVEAAEPTLFAEGVHDG